MMRFFTIVLAVIALGTGHAAVAGTPATEPQDARAVDAAIAAVEKEGLAGLSGHMKSLLVVLDHAPASYPRTEIIDGQTVVRVAPGEALPALLAATLAGDARRDGGQIVAVPNVYPIAALLLGSYLVENKAPEAAITVLDRGLALQPSDGSLTAEKGAALMQMRRFDETIALADAWLKGDNWPSDKRALLLRHKGFALIELNRLDEAETAYRESLKTEPDHGGALNELTYIARLKAGGATVNSVQTTGDKAKAGQY